MKWTPIEDLPAEASEWIGQDYLTERARWHEAGTVRQDPALDRSILDLWTEERHRLFAIGKSCSAFSSWVRLVIDFRSPLVPNRG